LLLEEKKLPITFVLENKLMYLKMIIGLAGRARSGKDTVALCIKTLAPCYEIRRLAQPVKDSLKALYSWDDRHTEGDLKEVFDPAVGKSPRQAMIQTAERVKQESGQDFFIKSLLNTWSGQDIVIPDVRFQIEIDHIRRNGGVIVKIERAESSHFSWEDNIDNFVTEYTLHNTSLQNLQKQVEVLVQSIRPELVRDA
jgi:hypothetical protein